MITLKDYEKAINIMRDMDAGTYYFELGKTDDGKAIALVLGYELGYNDGEDYQVKCGDKTYTLCGKIAVNIDDLQCDYNIDWFMPWNEDGDVYNTSMALSKNHAEDLTWFLSQADEVIKLMDEKVLTI